jgi:hypothetical protein
LKKWALKKIDKIRRGFLWRGAAEANGGHCLVRWTKASRPKKFGGLGILDLDLFGRALRLRWMWLEWVDPDRPWGGTELPVTEIDRQLFRTSTVVTIGDGQKASFWNSSWLNGRAPMDIAPDLFKLAWRKGRKVREELENHSWTRGLWRMNSVEEMAQFVVLWDMVQDIEFVDRPDEITWRWTADGSYSSRSAYTAQFNGSYSTFKGDYIWKAHAEGKHKFFAWLLVQCKILTTDKLVVRNCPCNPMCALCDQEPEDAAHLCLHCVFAKEVWLHMSSWSNGLIRLPSDNTSVEDWWHLSLRSFPAAQRRNVAALMMYTMWNIWKERNRRIFEGTTATPASLLVHQGRDRLAAASGRRTECILVSPCYRFP